MVAIPLTGVVAWMSFADYRFAVRANSLSVLSIAEAAGASTAQFLSDVQRQLDDFVRVSGGRLVDPATCQEEVRRADQQMSFAFDVAVIGRTGTLVCTSRVIPEGASRDFSSEPWFAEVMRRDAFTSAPPERGSYSGRWVLPFLVPIHDEKGRVAGILGVSIEANRFQDLLSGLTDDPDALVTLANPDRVIIARSDRPDTFVGDTLPGYPSSGEEVRPFHWLTSGVDLDGIDRAWGRVDLPAIGWEFFAGLPMERVRGPALAAASRRTLLVGVILGLALLAGVFIQRGIAGSLGQLRQSVREAAAGGEASVPEHSPVEVREVGEQLNRTLAARDEAQIRAQAAQARFLSILENAVLGIFLSEGDRRFLHVNPALAEMLGYSPEELEEIGPRDLFLDDEARKRFDAAVQESGVFRRVMAEWVRKDGSKLVVELTGRRVPDPEGQLVYEVHAQDVTAQRRFERELQQSQKMEAVGRLAGGVAHDFNNLLTVISGNLLLVLEDPSFPEGMKAEVGDALTAADRAAGLTRKLLAFSRKDRPQPRVVDADELVRGIHTLLVRLIPERIELKTTLAARDVAVVIDPGQFEQTVMNLVLNARDAISGNGVIEVSTSLRTEPPPIEAPAGPFGWFHLRVRDDGVGMSSDVAARVFEPFFTTKGPGEGTGLGLATVHAVVTQNGGHVSVESAPGAGTVFDVWLPAVAPGEELDEGRREKKELWARGESILVIEDEEAVREMICRVLERVGYQVAVAQDGAAGLDAVAADEGHFDLVLCDVVMPVMGGIEVAETLGRTAPDLPVLLMSGYSTDVPPQPTDPGVEGNFMAKPFTPSELLRRVRRALDGDG